MQSEDGECLSPEAQTTSESVGRGGEDELDFEGDFPTGGETDEPTIRKQEKEDGAEDGEVPESESGHTDDSDLEEGELKEDEDEAGTSADVCKYYPRGSCTWGSECRFSHQSGLSLCPDPSARLTSSAGPTSLRRNIPPLLPPPQVAPFATRAGPMAGLKTSPRAYFPAGPVTGADPLSSSWERGLRSAKERVAKAKERKESEVDFDDKRLNLTVPDDAPHRHSQSTRHSYASRESSSYASRDQRSSTSHHYSSSYYQSTRDYRHSHSSHQSHDESEYERRQRLAYQSAPRPEEWNDNRAGRPRPLLLDRYGREIQRCSRPDDYIDKWKRSPVRPPEKVVRETGDLSSISTSDSPSGLSGTSDSDSDGSWSDGDRDRKRTNQRPVKPDRSAAPVIDPDVKPASTSGMKRIPKISERQQVRDRLSPKRTHNKSGGTYASKDKISGLRESEKSRSFRSSNSDSDPEAEYDASKGEKRKTTSIASQDAKRRRDSHQSNGPMSPSGRRSVTPRRQSSSSSESPSPKREKDRFVMDFVGKSQRIKPNDVAETLNRESSDEGEESREGSRHRGGNEEESVVDKAAERKKLLEQLKAVEAAIAAKKQPLRHGRRKL